MTVDDVIYDDATHTSRLRDGRPVPHVTTVLGEVGVATDFDEIASLSLYKAENVENARLRGQAVHADCHAYDDGELVYESVHQAVRPYLDAWAEFRERTGIIARERERRLFHPHHFYTGRMDGIFWRDGDEAILIDIKTGDPEDSACHLQTAAYECAYRLMTETDASMPIERWAVQLTPKNRVPYRIKDYSSRRDAASDLPKWLACLCVYNEQRERRRRL